LMGVEIENLIESSVGVALPPTSLLRARTIGQIATLITGHLGGGAAASGPVAPVAAEVEAVSADEIDFGEIADEELERLVAGGAEKTGGVRGGVAAS